MPSPNWFFIIKSYTEEDLHKAIKYGLWSSTQKGNQVLDEAFADVEAFKKNNPDKQAEVYLFYSVNKSKHFQGVARMIGPVNHDK
jgi:hypothetical protein